MKKTLLLASLMLGTGCGQGTDPLESLGDPSQVPEMTAPIDSAVYASPPYSAANPHLTINMNGSSSGYKVKAPARGLITALDGSGTNISVTGYFNSHYTWSVTSLKTVDLRVGDVVKQGQDIGTANELMTFKLFKDGDPTCPYPFLDATGKIFVNVTLGAACI